MLRLWNHLLFPVRAASPLHHLLLSTGFASASSARFSVDEYLVATCGLTPAIALRASKDLAHIKSPAKPDAVLAFLAGVGLARSDITAAIARYPRLLCSKVDVTLTPRFAQLTDIGLSSPQISRLIVIVPSIFVNPRKISRLQFYLSLLGSYDQVHTALKRNRYLLDKNIELIKPNIALLQQCGLTACDIAEFASLLCSKPQCVAETVARAENLGFRRSTRMFKSALWAACCASPETISAKMVFLKLTLGCSEADLPRMVRTFPQIVRISEAKLSRTVNFLTVDVGLKPQYIVHKPQILGCSLQKRLMPRHYVMKVLKEKGLVKEIGFYTAVSLSEKKFVERFLVSYNKSVPELADAYAGEIPREI